MIRAAATALFLAIPLVVLRTRRTTRQTAPGGGRTFPRPAVAEPPHVIRCVRCLRSFVGDDPAVVFADFNAHRCNPGTQFAPRPQPIPTLTPTLARTAHT